MAASRHHDRASLPSAGWTVMAISEKPSTGTRAGSPGGDAADDPAGGPSVGSAGPPEPRNVNAQSPRAISTMAAASSRRRTVASDVTWSCCHGLTGGPTAARRLRDGAVEAEGL